jgi:hypothetical protein
MQRQQLDSRRMGSARSRGTTHLATVLLAAVPMACGSSGGSAPVGVEQSTQARIMSPSVPAADASELSTDNQAFAVALYQELRAAHGAGDNLVFSPASVSIALAMLYNITARRPPPPPRSRRRCISRCPRIASTSRSTPSIWRSRPHQPAAGRVRFSCRWRIRPGSSADSRSCRRTSTSSAAATALGSTRSTSRARRTPHATP